MLQELKEKIKDKSAKVGVIGLGYVGLPLAVAFAKRGFKVTGIDTDKDRVKNINTKTNYIVDVKNDELKSVVEKGRLYATQDFSRIKRLDVILICVPTPLKRRYHPDISFILKAVRQIARYQRRGSLVVLESTTYPGTTEEVIKPILESRGLVAGQDFWLAFSPERIDPGNKKFNVSKIPKVVGGITEEATRLTRLFYENVIEGTIPVSSTRVAEMVKLLENTFRLVNIGLIDELAMMAHKMGIDIWEVIEAARTKPFGFMPFYPGPGVGGHCIPKDPLYLYWKAKKYGFKSKFIKLSSEIITHMPRYVVQRVQEIIGDLKNRAILIIGVTYKKDVKDLRKSPSLDIIEHLQRVGARVSYYDPLIPFLKINDINLRSKRLSAAMLKSQDIVIIATDHSTVDYSFIKRHVKKILDCRNVYSKSRNGRIFKI